MDNLDPTWVTAGIVVVAAVHRFILSNRPQRILGAIIPLVWIALAVTLAANGILSGISGWLSATIVLIGLLIIWWSGQVSYKKRLESENARIDSVNASKSMNTGK